MDHYREWLSQQQGSVSKADIQKFLKENRVQIVEVVKGGFDDGEVASCGMMKEVQTKKSHLMN